MQRRRQKTPLLEYVRFGLTGALNTGTDFVVLNTLLSVFGGAQGATYMMCKAASFLVAVIQSYFLNKYWVFRAGSRRNMEETARFFTVSVAGFVINIATSSLVFAGLSAASLVDFRLKANIGALIGTLAVLTWNYIGYKFFVFKAAAKPVPARFSK